MKTHPKTHRIVKGFLGYLSDSRQGMLLSEVADELHGMVHSSEKSNSGIVTSAVGLSAGQVATIAKVVKKIFGRDIQLSQEIDKALLGGFTVKVGDWFVDASLAHDLQTLKQTVTS